MLERKQNVSPNKFQTALFTAWGILHDIFSIFNVQQKSLLYCKSTEKLSQQIIVSGGWERLQKLAEFGMFFRVILKIKVFRFLLWWLIRRPPNGYNESDFHAVWVANRERWPGKCKLLVCPFAFEARKLSSYSSNRTKSVPLPPPPDTIRRKSWIMIQAAPFESLEMKSHFIDSVQHASFREANEVETEENLHPIYFLFPNL